MNQHILKVFRGQESLDRELLVKSLAAIQALRRDTQLEGKGAPDDETSQRLLAIRYACGDGDRAQLTEDEADGLALLLMNLVRDDSSIVDEAMALSKTIKLSTLPEVRGAL